MKKVLLTFCAVAAVLVVVWLVFAESVRSGKLGEERLGGEPTAASDAYAPVLASQKSQMKNLAEDNRQILFGDLHVHSTYSTDAFLWALPLNHGQGVHPVADACDFARHCSAIDFWAITDHAEASTPFRWQQTKQAVRQCEALAGDTENPDLVSLLGFEWTQVGRVPSEHFGHKNVIFKGLAEDEVAARPIAAKGVATDALRRGNFSMPAIVAMSDFSNRQDYYDLNTFIANIRAVPDCDPNIASSLLPLDCFESTQYPEELLARLDEQELDTLVIPHGSSWGFYTPPATTWDKQLQPRHLPERFPLIEIYSGHGNSEEYRDYVNVVPIGEDEQSADCPPIQKGFTPACQRAGEIIFDRCMAGGESTPSCETKAAEARKAAASMGVAYHVAIGGESPEDWLDSGQCQDCYLPPFNHRPGTSVQYGLAKTHFAAGQVSNRFNWGFIASSDNHRARPGTGYKEVARRLNTEAGGVIKPVYRKLFLRGDGEANAQVNAMSRAELTALTGLQLAELERQSSFWQTGGLAAVHVEGRNREQLWDALNRRETYATSGPRILLWFDRIAANGENVPMGASLDAANSGRFRVRGVGSFKQKAGCPDHVQNTLGKQRTDALCSGECYHPGDQRYHIERIEIIRIRPQIDVNEAIADLIDDPFLVHQCEPSEEGCVFEFEDADFVSAARDTLYYARVIEEPRPTINAEPIECERDSRGKCIKAKLCLGDYRTSKNDDCLSMKDARAWSSPIYLRYSDS